jgi:hypothetical protein
VPSPYAEVTITASCAPYYWGITQIATKKFLALHCVRTLRGRSSNVGGLGSGEASRTTERATTEDHGAPLRFSGALRRTRV